MDYAGNDQDHGNNRHGKSRQPAEDAGHDAKKPGSYTEQGSENPGCHANHATENTEEDPESAGAQKAEHENDGYYGKKGLHRFTPSLLYGSIQDINTCMVCNTKIWNKSCVDFTRESIAGQTGGVETTLRKA
jgi:hypothetical protein